MDVEARIKDIVVSSMISSDTGEGLNRAIHSLVQDVVSEAARPHRGSKLLVEVLRNKIIHLEQALADREKLVVSLKVQIELATKPKPRRWLSWLSMVVLMSTHLYAAEPSPDRTRIPPGNEIIDSKGMSWKMERKIYVEPYTGPSAPYTLDKVDQMVTCNNEVYAHTMTGQWYKGVVGSDWILIGTVDPCL